MLSFWSCKKRFEQKDKFNFKIYDVIAWLKNSYIRHIAQYLTKKRQYDNEIWLDNRI